MSATKTGSQNSFALTIDCQRFRKYEGKLLRVNEKMRKVLHVSAVVFPAYEGTEFKAR